MDWYAQRIEAAGDPELAAVLAHDRDEGGRARGHEPRVAPPHPLSPWARGRGAPPIRGANIPAPQGEYPQRHRRQYGPVGAR